MSAKFPDLDRYRLPEGQLAAATRCGPPRHRRGERFLKGPIPEAWLCRAARLPGKALAVSLALWSQAGVERDRCVKLTTRLRSRFGVGRQASYRALRALEAAGLVSVERHAGRSPTVCLLRAGAEGTVEEGGKHE